MRDPTRHAERLIAIRLQYTINTHLEDQGVTTPAAIGAATALLALEVVPPDTNLRRGKERARCMAW